MSTPAWHWPVWISVVISAAVLTYIIVGRFITHAKKHSLTVADYAAILASVVLAAGTTAIAVSTKFVPGYGWWKPASKTLQNSEL